MSLSWTKAWEVTDDGTTLRAVDLKNIQGDIDAGLNDKPSISTANTFAGANNFTGVCKFGSATDYASFSTDGSLSLVGNATVWDDLVMPLTSGKQGATAKPDYDYTNNGYLFPQNDAAEKLYLIAQMPHSWKEGSSVNPHIHWAQSTSTPVTWKMDYQWINLGSTIGTTWTTATFSTTPAFTYTSGTIHQLSAPAAMISGTGKTLSSLFLIKLYRDDNTTTGDVLAFQFDIHYERDSMGSRQELVK